MSGGRGERAVPGPWRVPGSARAKPRRAPRGTKEQIHNGQNTLLRLLRVFCLGRRRGKRGCPGIELRPHPQPLLRCAERSSKCFAIPIFLVATGQGSDRSENGEGGLMAHCPILRRSGESLVSERQCRTEAMLEKRDCYAVSLRSRGERRSLRSGEHPVRNGYNPVTARNQGAWRVDGRWREVFGGQWAAEPSVRSGCCSSSQRWLKSSMRRRM